jgi:DNA transposition AAA+ family ATPase
MQRHATTTPSWETPKPTEEFLAKHSEEDVESWRALIARVIEIAGTQGWTKAEVARRCGVADATFSQVISGKYLGVLANQTTLISRWIEATEESASMVASIPQSPEFNPRLRIAQEIIETLTWAQLCPDLVMITIAAGMGKTAACEHFARTRPHVYHATMYESAASVHGMLTELAAQLEVQQNNPAKLARAIGAKLARTGSGTLLIVDEAQHLNDAAVNQLRYFCDIHKCGVAIVGNEEVYRRFKDKTEGRSYAQIKRRIGKTLRRPAPYVADVKAYIASWSVTDLDCVKFLLGVGMKDGALGQIEKTAKMATMIAIGDGEPLSLKHLQAAWRNRDVEDMA